jgi:hypothetical protein
MNGTSAIGIGTESTVSACGASMPGLPNPEIANNGSTAPQGSTSGAGESWRDLLASLGLTLTALPSGKHSIPAHDRISADSVAQPDSQNGAPGAFSSSACTHSIPLKLARYSRPAQSDDQKDEWIPASGRKRPTASSPEIKKDLAQPSSEISGALPVPIPSSPPDLATRPTPDTAGFELRSPAAADEPGVLGQSTMGQSTMTGPSGFIDPSFQVDANPAVENPSLELSARKSDHRLVESAPAGVAQLSGGIDLDGKVQTNATAEDNDGTPPAQPALNSVTPAVLREGTKPDKELEAEPAGSSQPAPLTRTEHRSENVEANLRSSGQPVDTLPPAHARSKSSSREMISGPVQQRGPKTSSSPDFPLAKATIVPELPGGNILNASTVRGPGGYAAPKEQAMSPAHPVAVPSDPFLSLDGDRRSAPATWIHAGMHHAEAGYLDPALGWIGVRADAASNGVHAALVPNSPEAAQVLGNHMAGLNAYLSEHHAGPAKLTITAPQNPSGEMNFHSGGHSSARQEDGGRREPRNEPQPFSGISAHRATAAAQAATVRVAASGGKYISVMA